MTTNWPKASRTTDPGPSHEAEAEVTESGARQKNADRVLKAVKIGGIWTGREVSRESGLEYHEVMRRLNDLRKQGLVSKHPKTWICSESGRRVTGWVAT